MRTFTPDDAKALRATVSTFPTSDYDLEEALTQAGTGEAIVIVMNERGAPTPVAWTRMRCPSTIGPSPADTIERIVAQSPLLHVFGMGLDRESPFKRLAGGPGVRVQNDAGAPDWR